MLYIVTLKINKDVINNIIGAGNSKKIVLQKIIFIIDKSIYTHNLFYQNSPFFRHFIKLLNLMILDFIHELILKIKS